MPAWGLAALVLGAGALVVLGAVLIRGAGEAPPVVTDVGPAPEVRPAGEAASGEDPDATVLAEAEQFLNRGDTVAAAELYRDVRSRAARRGDVPGEAAAVFGLGRLEHLTGQGDAARARYAEALSLYRETGDAAWQARVLAAMGDLEKDTFQWAPAAEYYRAARAAWEAAPPPKEDPHIVLNLADAPRMPFGEAAARALLEEAELLYGNLDDALGLADVNAFAADLERNLGNVDAARAEYGEARALYERAGAPARQAAVTLEIARIDLSGGANLLAAAGAEAATALFAQAGDSSAGAARARALLGGVERLQGRMSVAREHYAAAAAALRELRDPMVAETLLALAAVERFLGARDRSLAALAEAEALSRASGDSRAAAEASLAAGEIRAAAAEPEAAQLLDAAIERFGATGDLQGEGRAWLARATFATAQGDAVQSVAGFRRAAQRFEEGAVPFGAVLALLGLGDALRDAGDSVAAAEAYGTAAGLSDTLESAVGEANRLLGLPPVGTLVLGEHAGGDAYGGHEAHQQAAEELRARAAENVAQFPEHNAEARALVAATQPRIAAARAFSEGRG